MAKSNKSFSIGMLSKSTGCKIPTIRYYEQIGLLPAPYRTEGNQRRYLQQHLERLRLIRHSRELGFGIVEIRELIGLALDNSNDSHDAHKVAEKHLRGVENKIERLTALKEELKLMVDTCDDSKNNKCKVIEVLSDHSLCQAEHL